MWQTKKKKERDKVKHGQKIFFLNFGQMWPKKFKKNR